ncbi:MAG: hypothetical protein WC582_02745 [Patescibacteria group bacterium]
MFNIPAKAEAKWTNPTDSLQIKIPGMARFTTPTACPDDPTKTCVPWIGEYIAGIYKYGIGVVGILAAVVLMFGGVRWLLAGGSPDKIGDAKAWIGASLTGLILALTSYMILYQINPDLVKVNSLKIKLVEKKPEIISGCEWTKLNYSGVGGSITFEECSNYNMVKASDDGKCKSTKPTDQRGAYTGEYDPIEGYIYTCCCGQTEGWSFDPGIENQLGDASDSLLDLLSCMRQKMSSGVGRISSISDSNYTGNLAACYSSDNSCKLLDPACVHSCTSCHYGGGRGDKSYAVDLGDEENAEEINQAAAQCGAKFLNEGDHIHISTSSCLNL